MSAHSAAACSTSCDVADELISTVEKRMAELIEPEPHFTGATACRTTRAASYHLASGGHRIRARLALHAGIALGLSPHDAVTIATISEILHNASLIHDDLQDRDRSRRGADTVWARFGDNVAVCTGDLLLSAAYGALAAFTDLGVLPALIKLVHARTSAVINGQCADLSAQDGDVVDIFLYERIAVAKSGSLLSLPTELALVGSGHARWTSEARRAAEAFAVGYQIVDDMEDIEKDIGAPGRPHSLNAVLILRAAGHDAGQADAIARRTGLRHLREAASVAGSLPHGSGTLLRELALDLSARL